MAQRVKTVTIIGYILGLLYGSSIFLYAQTLGQPAFTNHALALIALSLAMFVGAVLLIGLRDGARRALIGLNALAGLYLLVLRLKFPDFVQVSYIFVHFIMVVFLIRRDVQMYFRKDWSAPRKCVLVVDDDSGILATVKSILLPNGYSVLTASTGERGVQVAKLQKPDLILLDVILPGIKGRDVCSMLKEDESSKNIPIIFLTAKDSPDDIEAEMRVGGASHLTKPVNAKMLLAEVKKILGTPS